MSVLHFSMSVLHCGDAGVRNPDFAEIRIPDLRA